MVSNRRSRKKKGGVHTGSIVGIAAGVILTAAVIAAVLKLGNKAPHSETESFSLPAQAETMALTESVTESLTAEAETETETEVETESETSVSDLITGTMYVTADHVSIRKEASTESEKIGELLQDTEVPVIQKDGEWVEAVLNDRICYVFADYLTDDKDWKEHLLSSKGFKDKESIQLDPSWEYAGYSEICTDAAVMYLAKGDRKGITIGVNAGHGTNGGSSVKTWCHPDKTPKVTGGTTAAGETKAVAVSSGMTFRDGTGEAKVTLAEAQILKDLLLENGYDVLMIRETDNAQLDNVARTVICNNAADCHIAIHWDGDGLDYDKGCFYMSVPEGIKYLPSVAATWEKSEKLGDALIQGLSEKENKIMGSGCMDMDLTQTSYSTVPSVDIELGNQSSDHGNEKLCQLAEGLLKGIDLYFGF